MIRFTPFPVIETENMLLRRLGNNDAADMFEMRKDQRMHEFTDTKPDKNINETLDYISKMINGINEDKWIIWAMEYKSKSKVIGAISIWNIDWVMESAELGFGTAPEYQGRGLMREALTSIVKYSFETMKLKMLDAYTEEKNSNSIRLLEGCGFSEVNRVCDKGYINDRDYNMIVYRLTNNRKL